MPVRAGGPEHIIFPLMRGPFGGGMAGRPRGVGPLRPWLKCPPVNGAWEYPDAFALPSLPKPVLFALRQKLNPIRQRRLPLPAVTWTIAGVSRDSPGAALAGCTCTLFRVQTGGDGATVYTQMDQKVSDASGNYAFTVLAPPENFRVTFDLAGAPVRAGITLKTLTGA